MERTPRPGDSETKRRPRWRRRGIALLGALALFTSAATVAKVMSGQSGQNILHKSKVEAVDPDSAHFGIIDWNMQNRAPKKEKALRKLIAKYSADAVLMQEVSAADSKKLAVRFKDWNINFVMGERLLQEPADGGFGNVIMTREKPRDIKTLSIDAESTTTRVTRTLGGMFQDVANADTSTPNMNNGMLERRAIIAETVNLSSEDKRGIRLITTHIGSSYRIHDAQLDEVYNFVKGEIKPGRPTIFCADLNDSPDDIIPKFTGLGFIVPEMHSSTSVNSNLVIDYCMYREEGILGLGDIGVNQNFKTDHHPIYGVWTPSQPAPEM